VSNGNAGIAIGAAASAQAIAAEARARRAEELACQSFVRGYQHDTATVESMQQYAKCIRILHPTDRPMTGSDVTAVKFVLVALLLGGVYNTWANRDQWHGVGFLLDFAMGVLGTGLAILCAVALVVAVAYVVAA